MVIEQNELQNKSFPPSNGQKKDKRQMKYTPHQLHCSSPVEIKEVEKLNTILYNLFIGDFIIVVYTLLVQKNN